MQIEGSTAFVTGGASGLGAATARRLAQCGAHVAIFDVPESSGAERAQEIGDAARFVPGDVCDATRLATALDEAADAFGPIRALINCAGVASARRVVDKHGEPFPLDVFRRGIEVNLVGSFNAIRLAALRMRENPPDAGGERGAIVNTASIAAFEGQIGQAAYAASKGGVVGMTLPIARELAAYGIRVCSIAPGLFRTPMLQGLPEPALQALGASTPFPARLGDPDEYAALVCHILENPMLNGETIRLDGALRMAPR